ncbi:MAG TPA: type II secretion system protein GspJ [Desulfuromonadales bacterium]|nr:type II secretion system protein GspJ [Desulfuromonadales bacterium]
MNRPQQGFTLVEILVAVSISSILLVTIYGVFTTMSNARIRVETAGEGYHQARVIFDRIGREIRSSYVDPSAQETRMQGGIDDRGTPFLALATTAGTPRHGVTSGVVLVRYELRQAVGETAEKPSLFRSETPVLAEDESPIVYRLASGIEALQMRFLDNGEWREEWPPDTSSSPPQAVEISLSLVIDETAVPFRSTFEVPDVGPN